MSEALPLEITDDLQAAIGNADATDTQFVLGYVGDDGWPHLAHRGTLQVYGPQQVAVWVRRRDDGLGAAVQVRPKVSLYQYDRSKPQVYHLYGEGRLSEDPEVDARIYAGTPGREQAQDPDRKGVAMIVDIDRIVAMGTHWYTMERSGSMD